MPGILTPWAERAALGHALDLRDHQAAATLGGLCLRQHFEKNRFLLHVMLPSSSAVVPAHEADIDVERLERQVLLAAKVDEL